MKVTKDFVFFYGDWPSNFTETEFYYPSQELPIFKFTSTEQGFMYFKALYFGDYQIAEEIYNTKNPSLCKKLGRKVSNFDEDRWSFIRGPIFEDLIYQKYLQDKDLQEKLLSPEFDGKLFVEASPKDRIWGVGLDENNPLILDPKNWKGLNLLGEITTRVRTKLLEK